MKISKIISLGLIILGLTIASCTSYSSQDSFSSSFISSEESSHNSSSISSESSSSSIEQSQYKLEPISDELMSFYINNISSGSGDIPSKTNISTLYNAYKQSSEQFAELTKYQSVYTLTGEDKYRCYYVTKDVYDVVQNRYRFPWSNSMLPCRGLTVYFDGYNNGSWSDVLKSHKIMQAELDVSVNSISFKQGEYYLLDIVRYYNDPQIDNYYFINFVSYEDYGDEILIKDNNHSGSFKYCCFRFKPRGSILFLSDYVFICSLVYVGVEIINENDVEVVKERFLYTHSADTHYYDDLEKCVVGKTYVESGSNYDTYDVTFDYSKIAKLFSF